MLFPSSFLRTGTDAGRKSVSDELIGVGVGRRPLGQQVAVQRVPARMKDNVGRGG